MGCGISMWCKNIRATVKLKKILKNVSIRFKVLK